MEHPGGGALRTQRWLALRRPRGRRRRQPGLVAQARPLPAARRSTAPGRARCPTPSCTATPTSASSTAPATPEELVEEAARLGLDGARPHRPRRLLRRGPLRRGGRASWACRTVFGAELSLGLPGPQNGVARPGGHATCCVLARGPEGYRRLCRAISAAQLRGGEKGRPVYDLDELADARRGPLAGAHRLPQGRGAPRRCAERRPGRGRRGELRPRWSTLFGADNVAVELTDHGDPLDDERNDALAELAADAGLPTVATTDAHYATPAPAPAGHRAGRGPGPAQPGRDRRLAARRRAPRTCARARRWPPGSPATRARWRAAAALGARAARSTCSWSRRSCRRSTVPAGHTEMTLAARAHLARRRRALRHATPEQPEARTRRSSTSWRSSSELDFPGYFLVVHDIVEFCREQRHPLPGPGLGGQLRGLLRARHHQRRRGRATSLLFERFLSPERDGPPDIDIDIESDRREEVIQYVYEQLRPRLRRPGRQRHHLPAAVGGARHGQGARATRPGQQDAWSKQIEPVGRGWPTRRTSTDIPEPVIDLADADARTSRGTWASTPAAW